MSRDQFLAELTQYLTFVSPADRSKLVSAFAEKFDSVGATGEATLIMELGTPMSIAIALKRRKEAGELILSDDAPAVEAESSAEETESPAVEAESPAVETESSAEETESPAVETESPAVETESPAVETESPAVETPIIEETAAVAVPLPEEPAAEILEAEAPATENTFSAENVLPEAPAHETPSTDEMVNRILAEEALGAEPVTGDAPPREASEKDFFAEEIPAINSAGTAHQVKIPTPEPRKKLSAPAAVGASLLSILITAVMLVFAALGAYLLDIMVNFIIGALQTLSTTTDALWMFAIGLVLGALGLLILWLSIWVAVSLIHRLFCGKPDTHSNHKLRLKKVWKTIGIIVIILLVLGIGCGAASYFMGGLINDLSQNPVYNHIYSWIDNTLSRLLALFVF